jgi:hypothetical protein
MALRDTIEGLVADLMHELLALVMTAPVGEIAELERRSPARLPAARRRPAPEPASGDGLPEPAAPVEPPSVPQPPEPLDPHLPPVKPRRTRPEPSPAALAGSRPPTDPFDGDKRTALLAPGLVREPRGIRGRRAPGRTVGDVANTSQTAVENRDEAVVRPAPDHEGRTASGHEREQGHPASHGRGDDAAATRSGAASPSPVSQPNDDVIAAIPVRPDNERTRTPEQRTADDAALLASGEPVALLGEIAGMLGVSVKTLRWVVQRDGAPLIRYLSSPRPVRHCIADVRSAVEAARPDIEARRRRAQEIEAAERAQAEASRAAKALAPRKKPHVKAPAKPRVVAPLPTAARSKPSAPDVLVVRRPGSR